MSTFLVTYDLQAPGRNYDRVYDYLKGFGTWWHNLDSTWLVVSATKTALEIRDELRALTDANDGLLVLDVTGSIGAWRNVTDSGSAWLKKHL